MACLPGRGRHAAPGALARSPQVLAQLRFCILAPLRACDLAVPVPRDTAAGYRRAQHAACVVRRTIANAAPHAAVLVAHPAAALFRTQHFAVLVAHHAAALFRTVHFAGGVHHAVALSAEDGSVIVTDAVAGEDRRNDTKGQNPGYNDARDHGISSAASPEGVCRG